MKQFKFNILFAVTSFSLLSFTTTQAQTSENEPVNIQNVLNNYVKKANIKDGLTGVPLTMQCQKYQNGTQTTFAAGLQSTQGAPVDERSLFQIGSNTKSFIAVIILQLEAEGKLSIDHKVGEIIPGEYPKWENITIKQLLNMTSGIHDYVNDEKDFAKNMLNNPTQHISTDELLDSVKNLDLWFQSGTNWKYSNTNFVLSGKIIEKVTGHSLKDEIQNRILIPLNLEHTYYLTTLPKENIPEYELHHLMSGYYNSKEETFPYFKRGQDIINYTASWMNAAGAITSTSKDLNTYARALMGKTSNGGSLLLPAKQYEELTALVSSRNGIALPNGVGHENTDGYGLGISASYSDKFNSVLYGHGGGTLGFRSDWGYLADKEISYALALNVADPDDFVIEALFNPIENFLLQNCL